MKVPKVDLSSPLAQKISKLKFDTTISVITGDFKTARTAHQELAKIGIDNFELITKVPNPVQGQFSLFSKEGWNALKFMISEKFRRKTPEEIKFNTLVKLYQTKHLHI